MPACSFRYWRACVAPDGWPADEPGLAGHDPGASDRAARAGAHQRRRTWPCYAPSGRAETSRAGVAQLAERQPSKLHVAGSNPVSRSNLHFRAQDDTITERRSFWAASRRHRIVRHNARRHAAGVTATHLLITADQLRSTVQAPWVPLMEWRSCRAANQGLLHPELLALRAPDASAGPPGPPWPSARAPPVSAAPPGSAGLPVACLPVPSGTCRVPPFAQRPCFSGHILGAGTPGDYPAADRQRVEDVARARSSRRQPGCPGRDAGPSDGGRLVRPHRSAARARASTSGMTIESRSIRTSPWPARSLSRRLTLCREPPIIEARSDWV